MRKIVRNSLLGCCYFISSNLGTVGHAEELVMIEAVLGSQSRINEVNDFRAAANLLAKNIIVDGVEYVPKGSEKNNKKNDASDSSKQKSKRSASDPAHSINGNLETFAMKGKYALGLEASVVNLGIGPSVEYWFTDNILVSGHLGLGSFTSYGIRGDYVFSKPVKLYRTYAAEPYAGIGYTFIKGPEESAGSIKFKTEGSGVDIHAGLFMPAQHIYKNVALRAEVAYSTATVEATAQSDLVSVTVSSGYSAFGFGFGIYYFFN